MKRSYKCEIKKILQDQREKLEEPRHSKEEHQKHINKDRLWHFLLVMLRTPKGHNLSIYNKDEKGTQQQPKVPLEHHNKRCVVTCSYTYERKFLPHKVTSYILPYSSLDDPPPFLLKRGWPSVNIRRRLKRSLEALVVYRRFKEEDKINNKSKFHLFQTHFRPLVSIFVVLGTQKRGKKSITNIYMR